MTTSHIIRWAAAVIMSVTCVVLGSGCATRLGTPGEGVTRQFFIEFQGQDVPQGSYDFSRLDKGYGLFVFSYETKDLAGNRTEGFVENRKLHIYVWEQKLSPKSNSEWDNGEKVVTRPFTFINLPSVDPLVAFSRPYQSTLSATFRSGRVVYGGRVTVTKEGKRIFGPDITTESVVDDIAQFRKACPPDRQEIPVDIVKLEMGGLAPGSTLDKLL